MIKRILIVSCILLLGILVVGGSYVVYIQYRLSEIREPPTDLMNSRVVKGSQLLTKKIFVEDRRLGPVTDILVGSSSDDFSLAIAGSRGALFLDRIKGIRSAVTFDDDLITHINIKDIDGDGRVEFVNRGGHWIVRPSVLNTSGKTIWVYEEADSIVDMTAGDLDHDGTPEFIIVDNKGIQLFDEELMVVWRAPVDFKGSVEMIDVKGDNHLKIVHANGAYLTVRDTTGKILKQIQSRTFLSQFSVTPWPRKGDSPYLMYSVDGYVRGLNVSAQVLEELPAPNMRYTLDARGALVKLDVNQRKFFAVLATDSVWDRSILYLYDPSDNLVYQEILDESGAAVVALPSHDGKEEQLLVGGNDKVWGYRAAFGQLSKQEHTTE